MRPDLRLIAKNYGYRAVEFLLRKLAPAARFSGDYATWEEASSHATSYDSEVIVRRVLDGALKVKRGEAAFERDAVVFDKLQHSWPLLTGLLWIAAQKENRLRLVDFGGSLGSSYFQARDFLADLRECSWNIVEQKSFVNAGKAHFEDDRLKFFESLDDCMATAHPDTILFSGALQYLPRPHDFLDDVITRGFKFVLIDRTPFFLGCRDRLMVQKVPQSIYPASYPVWVLNLEGFLGRMTRHYDLIADFESPERINIPVEFKGFIFRKRT